MIGAPPGGGHRQRGAGVHSLRRDHYDGARTCAGSARAPEGTATYFVADAASAGGSDPPPIPVPAPAR
ncbi:hypothetical protein ACFSTD_01690 [Novosphingobium colocasiae]